MPTSGRRLLKDLTALVEAGFDVDPEVVAKVQEQTWIDSGLVQIWECRGKEKERLEAYSLLKSATCARGHLMRVIWEQ